jgi:hypothetical protein
MVYNLATVLATFQKIGQFFPNHLVTLQLSHHFANKLFLSNSSEDH